MSYQFKHYPKGSAVGTGDIKFRHYGDEGDVWDGTIASSFAGGSGTLESPYLIATGSQLAYLASVVNSGNTTYNAATKYYRLTNNLNLNNIEWTPIGLRYIGLSSGGANNTFLGNFNGDGYTIKNMQITETSYLPSGVTSIRTGLFGQIGSGVISNINLENVDIDVNVGTSQQLQCGGLVGFVNGASITNCRLTGTISYINSYQSSVQCRIGGIAGYVAIGTITNCSVIGSVYGYGYNALNAGGICGEFLGSAISKCRFSGEVTGGQAGGIVSICATGTTVSNCYSTGTVSAENRDAIMAGGICGYTSGSITNCYSTCNVITRAVYNTIWNYWVGGICGGGVCQVSNCFAVGNVSLDGSATNKYSGDIVGKVSSGGAVTNCYKIDTQTITGGTISYQGTAATQDELQSETWIVAVLGWSFDVWNFEDDMYPTLI